jgi:AcrR family transcriptional regulator
MMRDNQRNRTRKDLLDAALRLLESGETPTLEQVAEAALVSRATAYRYFRKVDHLLLEASLHLAFPDASTILDPQEKDPVVRLKRVDEAVDAMISANETSLRLMMANAIQRAAKDDVPARQNRRLPLIEAALAPSDELFDRITLEHLKAALSLIIGPEAMVVFKDVLQLSDAEAHDVRHWAIQALVEKALMLGSG